MARQGNSNDGSGANQPFDDEKTIKMRKPDIGPPPEDAPDKLMMTVVDVHPVPVPAQSVLPFRESPPGIVPPVVQTPAAPQYPDFTGTVRMSLDAQLRAEIQQAVPFTSLASPKPSAPAPAAVMAMPDVTALNAQSSPGGLPEAFRAHLSASAPVATPPRTIGEAAVAGVLGLSNEAARTANVLEEARPGLANAAPMQTSRDPIVLLYLDRASIPRIVRKPAWQKILDAMDDVPIDPEADDPALSRDPSEIQDQAQIYAIMKRGRAVDIRDAYAALDAAAAKPGRFAPPIEIFEGHIEPLFDEVEHLRALVSIVTPFAKGQEKLEQTLVAAKELLELAASTNVGPLARQHRSEIRTAYTSGKQGLPFDEIVTLVLRGLLEQRKYQKQSVLGGEHICARFHVAGYDESQPMYIPAEAATFLPLSQRFFARAIVEIHFAQDERETNGMAWRCLALGNFVRRNRR